MPTNPPDAHEAPPRLTGTGSSAPPSDGRPTSPTGQQVLPPLTLVVGQPGTGTTSLLRSLAAAHPPGWVCVRPQNRLPVGVRPECLTGNPTAGDRVVASATYPLMLGPQGEPVVVDGTLALALLVGRGHTVTVDPVDLWDRGGPRGLQALATWRSWARDHGHALVLACHKLADLSLTREHVTAHAPTALTAPTTRAAPAVEARARPRPLDGVVDQMLVLGERAMAESEHSMAAGGASTPAPDRPPHTPARFRAARGHLVRVDLATGATSRHTWAAPGR